MTTTTTSAKLPVTANQLADALRNNFLHISGGYKIEYPYLVCSNMRSVREKGGPGNFYINVNEDRDVFIKVAKKLIEEHTGVEEGWTQTFQEIIAHLGFLPGWEEEAAEFKKDVQSRYLTAFSTYLNIKFCKDNPAETQFAGDFEKI